MCMFLSHIHTRRKKPAGAVSMFGGVDIFGKSKGDQESAPKVEATPPTQPKTAPTQPKPKPKSSAGGGLFGEGDDDDDDDDIFSFQPAKSKSVYQVVDYHSEC